MQCVIIPNCVFMVKLTFIVSITTTARTYGKAGLAYPGLTLQTNLQENASAPLRAGVSQARGCSRAPPKRQRRRQSRRWSLMVPSSLKHLGMMLLIYNAPRLLLLLHWFRPSSFMVSHMQRCIHFITIMEANVALRCAHARSELVRCRPRLVRHG